MRPSRVHADVITWLEHADRGCTSLKLFANWVDTRSEIASGIVDHTSQKDNRAKIVRAGGIFCRARADDRPRGRDLLPSVGKRDGVWVWPLPSHPVPTCRQPFTYYSTYDAWLGITPRPDAL